MSQTRRKFLASSATLAGVLLQNQLWAFERWPGESKGLAGPDGKPAGDWYLRMRRVAQHNLNEYDPKNLKIDEWVDYWVSLELDAIILTAGGFLAMYPTKLPHHYRSQFLGDRDLFGDYTKALKKKGIRVIARLETNFLHEDIYKERPEWFELNKDGTPVKHSETPWVYRTCLFSGYRNEQIPKIIAEVLSLYEVDGFFTNSWPEVEHAPHLCHCRSCQQLEKLSVEEITDIAMKRTLETINLLNKEVKKKPGVVYSVNVAGGLESIQDLKTVGNISDWINSDHQGRGGNTPIWNCAQQGRITYSVMRGRPVSNVIGIKTGPWRHSSNSAAETTLWMAQTTSSGMIPWVVCLGSDLPDKRWQEIARKYYQWLKKNEVHFFNKRPMARLGVVFSQRLNTLYKAPGKVPGGYWGDPVNLTDKGNPADYLQGMYYALLEGRFIFDLIHEDDLTTDVLKNYSALILPNVALLSDAQADGLRRFVSGGGSLLATFETGLYDEKGHLRSEFALSDIFDARLKPGYKAPTGSVFYTSVEGPHPITHSFEGLEHLPGGEFFVPVSAPGKHVLNIVPPYPNGIPEMVYPYPRKELDNSAAPKDIPALVVREKGKSRLVYIPTDLDKAVWTSGSVDMSRLMQDAIRWMLQDQSPLKVEGEGDIELFAWETEAGFALHVLNYNNPNMTRPSLRRTFPIGEQKVRMELPAGVKIAKGSLLRAGTDLVFKQTGNIVEFVIPSIDDFEIAALYRS